MINSVACTVAAIRTPPPILRRRPTARRPDATSLPTTKARALLNQVNCTSEMTSIKQAKSDTDSRVNSVSSVILVKGNLSRCRVPSSAASASLVDYHDSLETQGLVPSSCLSDPSYGNREQDACPCFHVLPVALTGKDTCTALWLFDCYARLLDLSGASIRRGVLGNPFRTR